MRGALLLVLIVLMLGGCGSGKDTAAAGREELSRITLPDGQQIRAELLTTAVQQQIGMMYREALPQDQGMLFVYPQPQAVPFSMHDVNMPLDLVFLGPDRRVVELVESAEPCHGPSGNCRVYGGHASAQFVLEINGGAAARHGVRLGAVLSF